MKEPLAFDKDFRRFSPPCVGQAAKYGPDDFFSPRADKRRGSTAAARLSAMVLTVALTVVAANLERPEHVISESVSLQSWWAQLAKTPSLACAATDSDGLGAMRMATESECLGAAKAAAAYAGLGEVRRVKAVDADATTVPYGCSYSHVTKAAVYNRNPMGACASSTDCLYENVCVVDESRNVAEAAAQAEAKAEAAEGAAAAEAFMEAEKAFDKKLAQALVAPAWPKHPPKLSPKLPPTPDIGAPATFDDRPCDEWTGLAAAKAEPPLTCGVLWYLHIPKTGGTTLMRHFHANKGRNGWRYANMWKNPIPDEERGAPGSSHQWATWNVSKVS